MDDQPQCITETNDHVETAEEGVFLPENNVLLFSHAQLGAPRDRKSRDMRGD
jgi:hypothetical protein